MQSILYRPTNLHLYDIHVYHLFTIVGYYYIQCFLQEENRILKTREETAAEHSTDQIDKWLLAEKMLPLERAERIRLELSQRNCEEEIEKYKTEINTLNEKVNPVNVSWL